MSRQPTRRELEALSTCAGFARGVLGLDSYPWAEAVFRDLDGRGSRVALKSCNGAGKTVRVAAPAALWHASVFPGSLTVCTSGVFRQVEQQLFGAVHQHAHRFRGWTFNQTEVVTHHGSKVLGFSTDEPGKFEGWHNENLLVVVDEAKSVGDAIFEAIERCQPTRLLLLSSPGGSSGEFYEAFHGRRKFYHCHSVAAADCPHISPTWVAEQVEKYGENHPLVRSMVFAEFMDGEADGAVVPLSFVESCLANPPEFAGDRTVQAFCDFAAGGDENVLAVRRGNRVEIVAAWREKDTMKAIGRFISLFRQQQLVAHQIAGDAGGLGGPVLDRMAESGWKLKRVHNGSPARRQDHFANLAAEMWYEARALIERRQVTLPNDRELIGQLTSRRGWADSRGKLTLESKQDMRNRALPSPDRADAAVGALTLGFSHSTGATVLRRLHRFERMGGNGHFEDLDHPFRKLKRGFDHRKIYF